MQYTENTLTKLKIKCACYLNISLLCLGREFSIFRYILFSVVASITVRSECFFFQNFKTNNVVWNLLDGIYWTEEMLIQMCNYYCQYYPLSKYVMRVLWLKMFVWYCKHWFWNLRIFFLLPPNKFFILSTDVTLVTDKTHYLTFNSHHLLDHGKG